MAVENGFQWGLALFIVLVMLVFQAQPTLAAETAEESHNETERYKIFTFDFERVELPYVICLWILIVALAKIGKKWKILMCLLTNPQVTLELLGLTLVNV